MQGALGSGKHTASIASKVEQQLGAPLRARALSINTYYDGLLY